MKMLKPLLFYVLIVLFFIGCSTVKNSTSTFGFAPQSIQKLSKDTLSSIQVDSIIRVDQLKTLNTWKTTELTDYETNTKYKVFFFYKTSTRITYTIRLLPNKLYVVEKKSFR